MARMPGLHGPIEDNVIDWRMRRHQIMADGRIDEVEARWMFNHLDHRNTTDELTAETLRVQQALLTGGRGRKSPNFLRLVHQRESEPMDAA